MIELKPLLGAETDVFTKIVIKADPYWLFCENTWISANEKNEKYIFLMCKYIQFVVWNMKYIYHECEQTFLRPSCVEEASSEK